MWIIIGIIPVVIFVLIVLWLVNHRPKAMNAEERIEQSGETEIVGGPEPRRKRTVEEIKKDILRQQELEEARKEQ